MKALTITLAAGAVLCGIMSAPASAMPMSNLAAAASDLELGQSVHYYRRYGYGHFAASPAKAADVEFMNKKITEFLNTVTNNGKNL